MTEPAPNDRGPGVSDVGATMILRQEQLRVGTQWVASGQVRISRRVVSETRTVEVTVRREELVVTTDAAMTADGVLAGTTLDGGAVDPPTGPPEPIVIVLREERAEVVTRVHPYERVTVHVDLAQTEQRVDGQVRTETVDHTVQSFD